MSNQFLTFKLESSQYAVEVCNVMEVLEYTHITKVPCAAVYMEGLINSRGRVISVVNLRKKFGMSEAPITKDTRIIVMEINMGENVIAFGAIADSVQEVIDLEDEKIEPSPKFGNSIAAQYIRGIGKRDDAFIIILNVDQIFSSAEIANMESVVSMSQDSINQES